MLLPKSYFVAYMYITLHFFLHFWLDAKLYFIVSVLTTMCYKFESNLKPLLKGQFTHITKKPISF